MWSKLHTNTGVSTIGVGRVVKLRSRLSGSQNLLFLSYCDDCYKAVKEVEATVSQILDEIIMQSSSFEQTLLVCKRWTYFYHLLFLSITLFHHFLHFENFGSFLNDSTLSLSNNESAISVPLLSTITILLSLSSVGIDRKFQEFIPNDYGIEEEPPFKRGKG